MRFNIFSLRPDPLGQIEVNLPANFSLTKEIEIVKDKKQKVNEKGYPLYKTNIYIDEYGNEFFDETTEARSPIAWKTKREINWWRDEAGRMHEQPYITQLPSQWQENEPIWVYNLIKKEVSIDDYPEFFDIDEVTNRKYELIADELSYEYCYANEFIDNTDIDLSYENHANIRIKTLELPAKGECHIKRIKLNVPADTLFLYLEADEGVVAEGSVDEVNFIPFQDDRLGFENSVRNIVLKFKNCSNKKQRVCAFAIFYNRGVRPEKAKKVLDQEIFYY